MLVAQAGHHGVAVHACVHTARAETVAGASRPGEVQPWSLGRERSSVRAAEWRGDVVG